MTTGSWRLETPEHAARSIAGAPALCYNHNSGEAVSPWALKEKTRITEASQADPGHGS